jgi:hypothetical protein
MTTIFSVTRWNEDMELQGSKFFMTLEGVAKWLLKQNPIDNKIRDREGEYDITANNLRILFDAAKAQGCAARFSFEIDFIFNSVKTEIGLCTVDVED